MLYDIVGSKSAFADLRKQAVKKVEKLIFFKRVCPWFWLKIGNFAILLLRIKG